MPAVPPRATPEPLGSWDRIICVDWSKHAANRAAWIADVATASLSPLVVEPTVRSLIAHATLLPGRTLIGIDAALGIPRPYLVAAKTALPPWDEVETFPAWLRLASADPRFVEANKQASDWRPDRPFIAVPGGKGSLRAFWERAGGELRRKVDVATGGKSPFIVSGIPGTVGSGSRALWVELLPLLDPPRDFGLWPFDDRASLAAARVVVGEIYPRACYALALSPSLPTPMRLVNKTRRPAREAAVDELLRAPWLAARHVRIDPHGLARARASEDDFDAMIAAAALLRSALDGRSLDDPGADPVEGGVLGLASIVRSGR